MNHTAAQFAESLANPKRILKNLLEKVLPSKTAPLVKIQFPGWIAIVSSLLIGGVAYNTGNNLVFIVLSLTLSLIIVSGLLSRFNLRRLDTSLDCTPLILSDSPATILISIDRTRSSLPVFGIGYTLEIHRLDPQSMLPVDASPVFTQKVYFAQIAPRGVSSKKVLLTPLPRGFHKVSIKSVRSAYPFGFFLKQAPYNLEKTMTVQPRPVELDRTGLPVIQRHGAASVQEVGEGVDLIGIRNYKPGDPLRRIHWKASAKTGRYLLRELAREQSPVITLFLPLTSSQSGTTDYEKAIRMTASLCKLLLREQFAVGLSTAMGGIPPHRTPRQLALLTDFLTRLPVRPLPANVSSPIPQHLSPSSIFLRWEDHHALPADARTIDLRTHYPSLVEELL